LFFMAPPPPPQPIGLNGAQITSSDVAQEILGLNFQPAAGHGFD